ncbi:hypothetical protein JNUCC1_00455 [Lentibacillus sp. JNUCC-1]|uniref:hypothetical protein n=1 Tax=Lentibacillus sp. JNUCC-1 TaxID=2654513 RepID=UPI0012E9123B|nr:hypothetical protein [Lentibacillus sp. JNUCC-1]MUV36652.1 hypothetical protein [Lentibacillus sp. JNUCC-1]
MERFVRSCRLCKREMEASPFTMCRECLQDSERIRQYTLSHPHASVDEIAESTAVSYSKVLNMIQLGMSTKKPAEPTSQQ